MNQVHAIPSTFRLEIYYELTTAVNAACNEMGGHQWRPQLVIQHPQRRQPGKECQRCYYINGEWGERGPSILDLNPAWRQVVEEALAQKPTSFGYVERQLRAYGKALLDRGE